MGENGSLETPESGAWMPLSEAIQVLGISEYQAYRFVRDEKLRAREWEGGRIEVWVSDASRPNGIAPNPPDPLEQPVSLAFVERISGMFQQHVGELLRPLTESHERRVELARENGALTERLAFAEREAKAARDSVAADKESTEYLRKRVHDVEEANTQLTTMLSAKLNAPQDPDGRSRPWPWIVVCGALVLVIAILGVMLITLTMSRLP